MDNKNLIDQLKSTVKRKTVFVIFVLTFLIVLGYVLRPITSLCNFWVDNVTAPFKRFIAYICSAVDFSVSEIVLILFVLSIAVLFIRETILIVFKPNRTKRLINAILNGIIIVEAIWLSMFLLWGVNYYAIDFRTRAGINANGGTAQKLYNTAVYFCNMANKYAELVERDENGVFCEDKKEIIDSSKDIYTNIERYYPFLYGRHLSVKPVHFSEFMSTFETTGVTFPFTGECNVNTDAPLSMLPFTAAHEIAHQRNIASEAEANYVGILACIKSENNAYCYSGYLSAYIYLCNALYRENHTYYFDARSKACALVENDLIYQSNYWKQYEDTKAANISDKAYDTFLKGYGQILGTKSYGAVVDLLIYYYNNEIIAQ